MPNSPDTEGFKQAQSRHADFIKTTRVMSQVTGLPLNELRARLRDAGTTEAQRQADKNPSTVPVSRDLPPLAPPVGQSFSPPAFSSPQRLPIATPAGSGPIAQKKVVLVDNGTANFYNIAATFIAAV